MRLFHISEQSNIEVFVPRIPSRGDMDKTVGLVWAIDEMHLPNFLTPRNCPRVTYHVGKNTTDADEEKFFSCPTMSYASYWKTNGSEKCSPQAFMHMN